MKDVTSISKLFHERSQFVLIGLTGRTGSGCTTTANILESKNPVFPHHSDAVYKNENFYNGLSRKRYNVARKYAETNWKRFYSIKVSDLISVYMLTLNKRELTDFILSCETANPIVKSKLRECIDNTEQSSKKIILEFSDFQKYLTDHESINTIEQARLDRLIAYMVSVREFTKQFKRLLISLNNDLYVSVYQAAGVSIRKVGRVDPDYRNMEFNPDSVFHLPNCINRLIKLIRKKEKKAFVVIDAIRNPYEARYFRDRYSAFYLMSINAPEEDRQEYLKNIHKFTVDQLKEIDLVESGDKDRENNEFIGQNVKKCIEMSDIHIFNPRNELKNNNVLKTQLAWYFSLMLHPGLISPTSMERVMQIAYTAKTNSGCISRQVGAVITDEYNSIKAVGWNDVPEGQYPCSLRSVNGVLNEFDAEIYSSYERNNQDFREAVENKYSAVIASDGELGGRNLSYCFKDIKNSIDKKGNQVHTRSLHAEENAFMQIAKYGGQAIRGGALYTTASPCELCAKKAYQLGVSNIVFIDPYPGITEEHILAIGANPPRLIQFRGAVGRGYHQLYEPVLPYKDELEYFL